MRKRLPSTACRILLDSGAFSAWNKGATIDLSAYIDFVKRNEDYIWAYVNLDVIPGEFGRKASYTIEQLDYSGDRSYENFKAMRAAGLNPMPVFHQGESLHHLYRMLDDGCAYIGLSVFKDRPREKQRLWLDRVFDMLTDAEGRTVVKVHGFGLTRPEFLMRYPWYTVDSTTWALHSGYGRIIVPRYFNGEFDYSRGESVVASDRIQGTPGANKKRLDYLLAANSHEHEIVRRFLEEELGLSLPEVRYSSHGRRKAIATYLKRLEDRAQHGVFENRLKCSTGHHGLVGETRPLTVMFATSPAHDQSLVLNDLGLMSRLLSFAEFKGRPDESFREYVMTGKLPGDYKPQVPKCDWESESYANYRKLWLYYRIRDKKMERIKGSNN